MYREKKSQVFEDIIYYVYNIMMVFRDVHLKIPGITLYNIIIYRVRVRMYTASTEEFGKFERVYFRSFRGRGSRNGRRRGPVKRRSIVLQIKTALLRTAAAYTGCARSVTVTEIDVAARACYARAACIYSCRIGARAATGFFRITGARTEPIFQIIVWTGPILAANRPTFNSVALPRARDRNAAH